MTLGRRGAIDSGSIFLPLLDGYPSDPTAVGCGQIFEREGLSGNYKFEDQRYRREIITRVIINKYR